MWIWFSLVWSDFARCELIAHNLIWYPTVWSDFPGSDLISQGLIWFPTIWSDCPQSDLISHDLIWFPTICFGFPRSDRISHGLIWCPTVPYDFPRTDLISHALALALVPYEHISPVRSADSDSIFRPTRPMNSITEKISIIRFRTLDRETYLKKEIFLNLGKVFD